MRTVVFLLGMAAEKSTATALAVPDDPGATQYIENLERADTSATEARVDALVAAKPKRKWVSYIWDSLDKSPEERKLVFKLDCALLTWACLSEYHINDYVTWFTDNA